MMPSILHLGSVNDYAHYIGAEVLHPLVSDIHYDELTNRSMLWSDMLADGYSMGIN